MDGPELFESETALMEILVDVIPNVVAAVGPSQAKRVGGLIDIHQLVEGLQPKSVAGQRLWVDDVVFRDPLTDLIIAGRFACPSGKDSISLLTFCGGCLTGWLPQTRTRDAYSEK